MLDKKAHWQKIYHDKSPLDVSWYQKQPELSLQLIHRSLERKDRAIIDVGGGASQLVDCLCNEGYSNLSVLDISAHALDFAKQRLGDLAVKVEWFACDITEFDPPQRYALWHDRAVFHFLTEEPDRNKYVNVLQRALQPGGYLVIAAFAVGGPERCSGLEIVQYDASRLMTVLGDEFNLLDEAHEIHVTPANKEQKFVYFRLVRK